MELEFESVIDSNYQNHGVFAILKLSPLSAKLCSCQYAGTLLKYIFSSKEFRETARMDCCELLEKGFCLIASTPATKRILAPENIQKLNT